MKTGVLAQAVDIAITETLQPAVSHRTPCLLLSDYRD